MWYDSIYACQDKKDDVGAGVRSIVLVLGQHVKVALFFFSAFLTMSWVVSGILTSSGTLFYTFAVGVGAILLAKDLVTVNLDYPKDCLKAFENNGFVIGPAVWLGFLLDYLLMQI